MTWRSTEFEASADHTLHAHTYRMPDRSAFAEALYHPYHVGYTHDHPGGNDAHTHDVSDLLDGLVKRWNAA